MDAVYEPNEWLRIETGQPGDAQESDFMNGTLQGVHHPRDDDGGLEFTVQTHVGIPGGIETEEALVEYLLELFGSFVALNRNVAFDIQTGPAGEGEEN